MQRHVCFQQVLDLQIAFVSTTAEGYKQTKQWVNYHRVIGVTHFYLFVDGVAARPEVAFLLLLSKSRFAAVSRSS